MILRSFAILPIDEFAVLAPLPKVATAWQSL
jgi:hypothetical protein